MLFLGRPAGFSQAAGGVLNRAEFKKYFKADSKAALSLFPLGFVHRGYQQAR